MTNFLDLEVFYVRQWPHPGALATPWPQSARVYALTLLTLAPTPPGR